MRSCLPTRKKGKSYSCWLSGFLHEVQCWKLLFHNHKLGRGSVSQEERQRGGVDVMNPKLLRTQAISNVLIFSLRTHVTAVSLATHDNCLNRAGW